MFIDDSDEHPESWLRMWDANRVGRDLARTALAEGRDVIVDNIKYQAEWVEPWEKVGRELGAEVLDICILAPKHVVEERARLRGYRPGGRLTPEKVAMLYNKVILFYRDRPEALFLDSVDLSPKVMADEVMNYETEDVAPVFEEGGNLYNSLLQEVISGQ
jgi:hypothetical protein